MVRESPAAYRITDLSAEERPRERLEKNGPEALSKAELLAILLRVGVTGSNSIQLAQQLLNRFGGLAGLQRASFMEVCGINGVGPAKAAQIKAAIELGIRLKNENPELNGVINSPEAAAELVCYEMQPLLQENLWVILLDTRNRKIFIDKRYKGSLNVSMVRVGELFMEALKRSAAGIILAHNHPSGDPTPSPEDVALTRSVIQAGKLLDVEVIDHLVIGLNSFVSMKQKGLGFA